MGRVVWADVLSVVRFLDLGGEMAEKFMSRAIAIFLSVFLCSQPFVRSGYAGESFDSPFNRPSVADVDQIPSAAGMADQPVEYLASPQSHPESNSLSYDFFDMTFFEAFYSEEPGGGQEPPLLDFSEYGASIVVNDLVKNHISFFQTRMKGKFTEWLDRSGKYVGKMKEIFKSYQLPEELAFLPLIESGFNPYAYSKAKAVGPWQFVRATGIQYGLRIDKWVDERRDPLKSTVAAAKYLKNLYGIFGSWPLSLASYNAGEGRIMRAMSRSQSDDFWELRKTSHIASETKEYVPKYMAATIIAQNQEEYGFSGNNQAPLLHDEVDLPGKTPLKKVAKASRVLIGEIKAYNPDLNGALTPPYRYRLKLPLGTKEVFAANFASVMAEQEKVTPKLTKKLAKKRAALKTHKHKKIRSSRSKLS